MQKIIVFIFLIAVVAAQSQTLQEIESNRVHLPNGWSLTPVGKSIALGDLPLNIAVSKSKKLMAVTNNGQSEQTIQLIDAVKEVELDNIVIAKSWYGLKFSADEKNLYAAGGNDNMILKYSIINNKLKITDSIILGKRWPEKIWPSGIEIDDAKQLLYVVTKENNSLYIIDLKTKKTISKIALGAEAYACLLSADKKILYISSWGGDKVLFFDVLNNKLQKEIPVGDNPNEMF